MHSDLGRSEQSIALFLAQRRYFRTRTVYKASLQDSYSIRAPALRQYTDAENHEGSRYHGLIDH
jgi:hypothetical protein